MPETNTKQEAAEDPLPKQFRFLSTDMVLLLPDLYQVHSLVQLPAIHMRVVVILIVCLIILIPDHYIHIVFPEIPKEPEVIVTI